MKYDKHILLISSLIMLCLISMNANAQKFTLQNTNVQGFTINSRNTNSINIKHNISDFEIKDNEIIFEGIQLQSEAGTPNLPNNSCFILIPNNSRPTVEIISSKEKIIENVEIRPAEKITADIIKENGLATDVAIASDNFHQLRAEIFAKKNGLIAYSAGNPTYLFVAPGYWAREILAVYKAVILGY